MKPLSWLWTLFLSAISWEQTELQGVRASAASESQSLEATNTENLANPAGTATLVAQEVGYHCHLLMLSILHSYVTPISSTH